MEPTKSIENLKHFRIRGWQVLEFAQAMVTFGQQAVPHLPGHQGEQLQRSTAHIQEALDRFYRETAPAVEKLKELEQIASN